MPTKLKQIKEVFKNCEFSIIDVGAGNHSASQVKKYFPNCKYYGIDISKNYNNNEIDFELMEKFWEKDLTKLEFDEIPNGFFDVFVLPKRQSDICF
jgi:hypothetical protein